MSIWNLIPAVRRLSKERDEALAYADDARDALSRIRREMGGIRAEVTRLQSQSVAEAIAEARKPLGGEVAVQLLDALEQLLDSICKVAPYELRHGKPMTDAIRVAQKAINAAKMAGVK